MTPVAHSNIETFMKQNMEHKHGSVLRLVDNRKNFLAYKSLGFINEFLSFIKIQQLFNFNTANKQPNY